MQRTAKGTIVSETQSRVSIPQAVSTVATKKVFLEMDSKLSFNTASGKYCCNMLMVGEDLKIFEGVSIPQAVSTVATKKFVATLNGEFQVSIPQAVSTVATVENLWMN